MNNKIYEDCEEKLLNKITSILVKTMNNKIYEDCEEKFLNKITSILVKTMNNKICHTAIENLSDPIGYLLDFTNPYYTALAGNMKARVKKDNSFRNHT